jgi:hypothetical protein
MSPNLVLLDANLFYSAMMRDLFMQLALTDLFEARWTEDIHREWIVALMRNKPNLNRTSLERTRDLMNQKVYNCLIFGYEELIPSLDLPDPDDRHNTYT